MEDFSSWWILPHRVMANAFVGPRLRPGASTDLWPEPDYPTNPLLVEYVGCDRAASGHRRSTHTYILWRYDIVAGEWIELVRSAAVSTEWVEPLKAVALRHLRASEPANPSTVADAAARVLRLFDAERELLESGERSELMGLVWEQLSARMVQDADHV